MKIRKAHKDELNILMKIFDEARLYMRRTGNTAQWTGGFPGRDVISDDIEKSSLYVGEGADGAPHLCFMLMLGEEPTYKIIDGRWQNDGDYAFIHRVASDGSEKGCFGALLEFCKESAVRGGAKSLRIDTHETNKTMRHILEKNDFTYCGTIYIAPGEPRLAYELILK